MHQKITKSMDLTRLDKAQLTYTYTPRVSYKGTDMYENAEQA